MLLVFPACKMINEMLGKQPTRLGKYKPSMFNLLFQVNKKWYVYNSFSRSLAEITEAEHDILTKGTDVKKMPCEEEAVNQLISERFLMQEETDEVKDYLETEEIVQQWSAADYINSYTVLTTTACNARCFYCFESDFKPVTMTVKTAKDLAEYMVEHCGGKRIRIHWFGGEPLCNVRAIDLIVNYLKEKKARFSSSMTSNGFAFTQDIVNKAKNDWNLGSVQITLDGMDEEHNRRKNYIVKEENPFRRTIKNIKLLLDAEIGVSLRLNFDQNNVDNMRLLIQFLISEFKGKKGIVIYPAVLFESCASWSAHRTDEQKAMLANCLEEFRETLAENGLFIQKHFHREFRECHCGSNNIKHRVVNPDGRFSVCHNYSDDCTYGNIYDGITDKELFDRWTKNTRIREKCKNCKWLPECTNFDQCPTERMDCYEELNGDMLLSLKKEVMNWQNNKQ